MRHYIKLGAIALFLIVLCFLGYKVFAKINDKKEAATLTEILPAFKLEDLAGNSFGQKDLKQGKPVVLIFFNTTCDYCQHEAQDIQDNIAAFKETQIVFISSQAVGEIETFAIDHQLNTKYDNVYFLSDRGGTLATAVEANSIPYMLVYDKDHQLLERIKGQTKASNLLALINPKTRP